MSTITASLCFLSGNKNPIKTLNLSPSNSISNSVRSWSSHVIKTSSSNSNRLSFNCKSASTIPFVSSKNYEFSDGSSEVELRLQLGAQDIQSYRDISVDANDNSLKIRIQRYGSLITLIETDHLFEKIKPAETIWYIDDDQLVVNLKKQDPDLKWPDIVESWDSLTVGSLQLLQGTAIFIVGDSTEINEKVAREIAVGIGYTPLTTKELLETYAKQTIDSWVLTEGSDSVAEAESVILESLSSHVRAVVATLGGQQGAARRADKWQHLYAGFTVWLSQTEATDEDSAKEEARRHIQDARLAYSKADVVVKLQGWDSDQTKSVAQASLRAIKQLVLSDKNLPEQNTINCGSCQLMVFCFGARARYSTMFLGTQSMGIMTKTNTIASDRVTIIGAPNIINI